MPISVSLHKASVGTHQNKLHDKLRANPRSQAHSINKNESAIPDEIRHFGKRINRIVNSQVEQIRPSWQATNSESGIATLLRVIMLLANVGRETVSENGIKHPVSDKFEQSGDSNNLLNTHPESIPQTSSRTEEFMFQYGPLSILGANEFPVKRYQNKDIKRTPRNTVSEKKKTPPPPIPEDVKLEKLDFSCFEERQNLSIAEVFRQIGNTLSNPVSELASESQVINFYNNYHRCPSPEEMKNLASITSPVDDTISIITVLLPGGQPLMVTQRLGGPLFRMMADNADNKQMNVEDLREANDQLLILGKSIADASPKNSKVQVIESQLKVPNGLISTDNKLSVNIKGKYRELIYENGKYFAYINGKRRRISYSSGTREWIKKTTNRKTDRIVKSLGEDVYFDHLITNKLNGALDKNTLGRINPNQHGIYTVTSKQSGEFFNAIKIGDKFYRYIPSNEKDVSLSGVIKTDNADIKVSRFDKRYFIVNEKKKISLNYSPCRLVRSPGASCLHLSDSLINKLNENKKNGIPANKIQGLKPSENQPNFYESAIGKFYLKYDDVYFKLVGGFDKKVDSKFMVTGRKRFGSKQITPICFSREKGNDYIITPEENMMESAGVSREMAMSHIEMHIDFTPVDLNRAWNEGMHGPFNLDKRFSAKRWITNKEPIIVYRQDNRSLDEIIAAGGFYPQKETLSTIEDHMVGSRDQYSYVSTSIKRLKSGSYGKYEYAIYLEPHQGIDTAATLEVSHGINSVNVEFAVPGIITPGQIKGWRRCN